MTGKKKVPKQEVSECLLLFDTESFAFEVPIQKFKE
jgi:hypothetical protein